MIRPRKRYQSSWIITFKTGYVNWSTFKENQNLVSLPKNAILLTADVVGVYPSTPHESGLQALEDLHRHGLVFSWMKLKLNFQEPEAINVWYGLDTSTFLFLFGFTGKKNLKNLWQI